MGTIRDEIRQTRPFESAADEAVVTLLATADRVRSALSGVTEAHAITLQQYNVLRILRGAGENGLPTLEIATRMIEKSPGITRLLDRLEDQGLVGKGECKEDARVSYAVLTEAGLAKIEEAWPEHVDAVERRVGAALSAEEIQTLSELLGRLSDSDESCDPNG